MVTRQSILRFAQTFIGCFTLISFGACGQMKSSTHINGSIGTANIDVYAYSEKQIDLLLASSTTNGKTPNARAFFDKLESSPYIAHTKSGPISGQFDLWLPKDGNFVLAAKTKGYLDRTHIGYLYWLVRISTGSAGVTDITLNGYNTVDSKAPGTIELDVTRDAG